ncbi:IclR family transcriptional regulator domain-containing protein [Azotobacter beijerinckii]|uniref:IclR family transcriptional regulator domain-containing protein n=1 Tax=Azotobacter beijerinckii TaxID=170623 RepID=UPI000B80E461
MLEAKLERRTSKTITSRKKLLEQLTEVRSRGWALDGEEHAVGVCGIGVFLSTGQSELYALSVAVPAARFEGNLDTYLAALFQCKVEIESLLAG